MHRRSALTALSVAVAVAAATAFTAAGSPPAHAATGAADTQTVRTAGGYDVLVGGVRRATVPVTEPAYTVRATASPDGRYAAAIADFDGTSGSRLLVIDKTGRSTEVATGRITSAVFSPSGALAYLDQGQVYVARSATDRRPAVTGRLEGRAPSLLGWTGDGRALLAVQHPDVQNDGTHASTLSRFDPATGATTALLASNPDTATFYRDLRLVRINGRQHVSFIRGGDIYRCNGGTSTIGLATDDGTVIDLLATTTDNYRAALWSPDGRSVAYELMGCVSKAAKQFDRTAAMRRLDAVGGVYVLDRSTGQTRRVMHGLSYNYPLAGFSGSTVTIGSAESGTRTLPATAVDAAKADDLDRAASSTSDVGIMARKNPAQHIHQLWDTRDDFNGNSSCGPTSAVIDLVTYQLPNEFGVTVSSPYSHYSKWGRYITDQYSAYGTTFNAAMGDYDRRGSWMGAHGWITGYFCGSAHPCAGWAYETDYLRRNNASVTQGNYDAAWVRARINEGKFVIMSGTWGATQGHLSVVVGYTDDNKWYVHDTYGAGTDGSFDGAYAIYTWGYIAPVQMWAA